MCRRGSRILLLGGLLGLLAACGEVPGGAGGISGTVSAPAGASVFGTEVSACFNAEPNCDRLGVSITQQGVSATYRLSGLPRGSYSVSAFKDSDNDRTVSNGDLFAYYSRVPGEVSLVTLPTSGVDILMSRVTGATPAAVRASLASMISNKR